MKLHLFSQNTHIQQSITITGSKSESNRLLLLQALFPQLSIENVSNSDDACVMDEGLSIKEGVVDIHHAGTAMRFLTAFCDARGAKCNTYWVEANERKANWYLGRCITPIRG